MDRQFRCGTRGIGRRTALKIGLSVALAPRLAAAEADAARERPREGDLLVAHDAAEPTPLKPGDLPLGGKQTMAWPMDPASSVVRNGTRLNKVLLLRLDPQGFDPATAERAADGVVAYSAICPHAGCDVTVWHADSQLLQCPCHYSEYDPKAGRQGGQRTVAAQFAGTAVEKRRRAACRRQAVYRPGRGPAGLTTRRRNAMLVRQRLCAAAAASALALVLGATSGSAQQPAAAAAVAAAGAHPGGLASLQDGHARAAQATGR